MKLVDVVGGVVGDVYEGTSHDFVWKREFLRLRVPALSWRWHCKVGRGHCRAVSSLFRPCRMLVVGKHSRLGQSSWTLA